MKRMFGLMFCLPLLVGCLKKPVHDSVTASQLEERVQILELKISELVSQLEARVQGLELKVASLDIPKTNDESEPVETIAAETIPELQVSNGPVEASPERVMEPSELYRQALQRYRDGEFKGALEGFATFQTNYPEHRLLSNTHYWVGETYYDQKDYGQAAESFRYVVKQFPLSPKAPDALLKLGYTASRQEQQDLARDFFQKVLDQYPFSSAAEKARALLAEM